MAETGSSGEQKTVVFRFDKSESKDERTFIGAVPGETEEKTRASNPSLEAPDTGQLRVVVTAKGQAVSANLVVDGERRGTSPSTLTLSAGPHQVRIELAGYRAIDRWATVVPGTSTNLRVFLEKL